MFYSNKGMPEENEIVLCKVTKVLPNSVFANLEEYNKSGMLHISEVSPGRIRNIRDYVKEGKIIICKILKIDSERGHIDLSLRRVSESQRRQKVDDLKKEQIAEKIVEQIAKKYKIQPKDLYLDVTEKLFSDYDKLYEAFEDFVENGADLKEMGIPEKYIKDFDELIRQRIKLPEYTFEGVLTLTSKAPNGIDFIKDALKKAEKVKGQHDIRYKGAGKFSVSVTSQDKKEADGIITKIGETAVAAMTANKSFGKFERID